MEGLNPQRKYLKRRHLKEGHLGLSWNGGIHVHTCRGGLRYESLGERKPLPVQLTGEKVETSLNSAVLVG